MCLISCPELLNPLFQHIILTIWFTSAFVCQTHAGYSSQGSDTTRIRLLKAELAEALYINQRKECYDKLRQLAIKTDNEALLANCCYELSYISIQQSDYPSTIQYIQQALRHYEAKKDRHGRARCYRIMGTLYALLSPEQANLYYNKCYELASPVDSADAVLSKCVMSIDSNLKYEKLANDINNINLKVLDGPQRATADYLYAVLSHRSDNIDAAFNYALKADSFFSTIPQLGYMIALNKHELASLYFARGNLEEARKQLAASDEICERDHYRLTAINNMNLLSEILHAEGREVESLYLFKKQISMRDSLLGLSKVQSINEMLMNNLLDETVQGHLAMNKSSQQRFYILLSIILILSIVLLYYFRDAFIMRKEKYFLLSQMAEQNRLLGSNPELKQHLSIIMFEYKKGLDYSMEQLRNRDSKKEDYQNLNRYMDEANTYVDQLKKWMDEQPYYTEEYLLWFEVHKATDIVVRLLEIIFISKQITIQNNIEEDIVVFGNRMYFSIAFEMLLFELLKKAGEQTKIILSTRDSADFVILRINSPEYVLPDEERVKILAAIQKMKSASASPGNNIEVCLKCIYENNGNMWFESDQEQGTVLNFTMPKRNKDWKDRGNKNA